VFFGPVTQQQREWTGQQEEIARDRCADAFLDDLREITQRNRVLILIDAYEDCPPPLARWLEKRLLIKHVLGEAATGLIVFVAGRQVPDLVRPGREQLVESVTSLSPWEDDDIRLYLESCDVVSDDLNVAMIRRGLRDNDWNFDDLESQITLMKKGA
jgi:hypothetical protein